MHGQERVTTLGGRSVLLYPLYHPAAALYTPQMLEILEADFARIPELMGRVDSSPVAVRIEPRVAIAAVPQPAVQLGLF